MSWRGLALHSPLPPYPRLLHHFKAYSCWANGCTYDFEPSRPYFDQRRLNYNILHAQKNLTELTFPIFPSGVLFERRGTTFRGQTHCCQISQFCEFWPRLTRNKFRTTLYVRYVLDYFLAPLKTRIAPETSSPVLKRLFEFKNGALAKSYNTSRHSEFHSRVKFRSRGRFPAGTCDYFFREVIISRNLRGETLGS